METFQSFQRLQSVMYRNIYAGYEVNQRNVTAAIFLYCYHNWIKEEKPENHRIQGK